jgi:hypothetical protein
MSVGAVDLLDASSHEAAEVEQVDAGGERLGGEVVPQAVDRAVLDASRFDAGSPDVCAPVVEVQVAPCGAGEHEPDSCGGMISERLYGRLRERYAAAAVRRLPERREHASAIGALH